MLIWNCYTSASTHNIDLCLIFLSSSIIGLCHQPQKMYRFLRINMNSTNLSDAYATNVKIDTVTIPGA